MRGQAPAFRVTGSVLFLSILTIPHAAPCLTVNAGTLKLTHAIRSLELPSRLSFRLARALDVGLRHRSAGDKTLRKTVTEVAVLLYERGGDAPTVVTQMRELVITHLEERGVTQSSVLAVAPVPVVFAAEIAEIVARSLGVADAGDAVSAPKARVARWIERARDIRKPPPDELE